MTVVMAKRLKLVTAVMASSWFVTAYHVAIKPATIRQWAARGKVQVYRGGQMRYDLDELVRYAQELGWIAK